MNVSPFVPLLPLVPLAPAPPGPAPAGAGAVDGHPGPGPVGSAFSALVTGLLAGAVAGSEEEPEAPAADPLAAEREVVDGSAPASAVLPGCTPAAPPMVPTSPVGSGPHGAPGTPPAPVAPVSRGQGDLRGHETAGTPAPPARPHPEPPGTSTAPVPPPAATTAPSAASAPAGPATKPAPTGTVSADPVAGPAPAPGPGVGGPTAPAGTPPPAEAPAAPVSRQVFPEVTRLVSAGNGTHRVTLQLNPEALGEVRVVLSVRDGEVHVRLAAGSEAQRALVEGTPELHRLLELAGASDTRIVVRDLLGPAPGTPATPGPVGQGGDGSARPGSGETGPGAQRSPDQHAGTRGGRTARDGTHDGASPPRVVDQVTGTRTAGVDVTV